MIHIVLMDSPGPRQVTELQLSVPEGTTVREALVLSGWLESRPEFANRLPQLEVAIWGRRVSLSYVLRQQDRLEFLRPLTVDPKVARRERFKKQGAKTAGLFTNRRPGAKAGY
jgi:putative ubiquitin-RnfH superfamily antitoxin RatB of RatAB toxin-antitoxin module